MASRNPYHHPPSVCDETGFETIFSTNFFSGTFSVPNFLQDWLQDFFQYKKNSPQRYRYHQKTQKSREWDVTDTETQTDAKILTRNCEVDIWEKDVTKGDIV